MADTTINLIATKTDEGPQLTRITALLKKISYGSVILLLITGFLVGGVYVFVQGRVSQLTQEKNTLAQSVAADSTKEGLLRALKDRVAVFDKLSASAKHMDKFFNEVSLIGNTGTIDSISLDDTGKAIISTKLGSIDQAITVTDTLIKEATAGNITKPSLISMTIDKDGGFSLSVSFVQVL